MRLNFHLLRFYRDVFFAILLLLAVSCEKPELKPVSIHYEVPGFDAVKLLSVFDVYLYQDSVFSVDVVGLDRFAENVVWNLVDKELVINNLSNMKFTKPDQNKIKLFIHADSLKRVKTNESCYIETLNPITSDKFALVFTSKINEAKLELDCKSFYYMNYFPSGGKLELSGHCNLEYSLDVS